MADMPEKGDKIQKTLEMSLSVWYHIRATNDVALLTGCQRVDIIEGETQTGKR